METGITQKHSATCHDQMQVNFGLKLPDNVIFSAFVNLKFYIEQIISEVTSITSPEKTMFYQQSKKLYTI